MTLFGSSLALLLKPPVGSVASMPLGFAQFWEALQKVKSGGSPIGVTFGTIAVGTASPLSVTRPAVSSGEVLVALVGANAISTGSVTLPSGWTALNHQYNGSHTSILAFKVAGGSEPASYSFTISLVNTAVIGVIAVLSNTNATQPDGSGSSNTDASGTSHVTPSYTPANAAAAVIAGIICGYTSGANPSYGSPFTNQINGVSQSVLGLALAVDLPNSVSPLTATATTANSQSANNHIAGVAHS